MIRIVVERPDQPPSVRVFPQQAVIIGRAAESDWCLPFPDVSRQHCRFTCEGGLYFVEGLSDRSPIYVNGRRIHGITRIEASAVVRFGNCSARLGEAGGAKAPSPSPSPPPEPSTAEVPAELIKPRVGGAPSRAGVIGDDRSPLAAASPVQPEPPPPPGVPGAARAAVVSPGAAEGGSVSPVAEDMSAIVAQALRWRELDRTPSLLLRGESLRRGRQWLRRTSEGLGEHGALVRQFVETSKTRRRVGIRGVLVGGAMVGGALIGGFSTARVLAGELALPDLQALADAGSQGCQPATLERAQAILGRVGRVEDERIALFMSLYAFRVAEQSRCGAAAAIEKELRARLAGQAGQVLGTHPVPVIAAALSPDLHYAASAAEDGSLYVWRLAERRSVDRIDVPATVRAVAWSNDSRLLILGDERGVVSIWAVDRNGVHQERELSGHRTPITSIAVSRSGELMATGDRRGEVRLWSMAGAGLGQVVGEADGRIGAVRELVFDANGKRLFHRAESGLGVWPIGGSGQRRLAKLERLPTDHQVTSMDVSRDGDRLLVGDESGQVFLWTVKGSKMGKPEPIYNGMEKIEKVAFVPTRGQALVATSERRLLLVSFGVKVRADKYAVNELKGTSGVVEHLVVDHSGSRALTVSASAREVWDLAATSRVPQAQIDVGGAAWRTLTSTAKHSSVIAGREDGRVVVWDLRAGEGSGGAHVVTDHTGAVDAVALSPEGTTLASGGRDGVVRVWRVDDAAVSIDKTCSIGASIDRLALQGERVAVAAQERVLLCDISAERPSPIELDATSEVITELAFSGNGEWLVAADRGGNILGWEARGATVAKKATLKEIASGGRISALAVSREHVAVATAGESSGAVSYWPLTTGSRVKKDLDSERSWTTVAFHHGGQLLAAGARDNAVRVWTLGSSQPSKQMSLGSSVSALAFSPGSEAKLAVGGEFGDVAIFDATSEVSKPLGRHSGATRAIRAISFASPNFLVTAVDDRLNKHALLGTVDDEVGLVGHTKPISGLAVQGSGKFAATASADGTVRVWPLKAAGLSRLVCERFLSDLSADEWAEYLRGESWVDLCANQ